MFAHPYDLKATYKFFADPQATPDHLQAGHSEGVLLEMETPGLYLLIEDTSEIRCADQAHPLPGLSPIGASKEAKIGFHLHSVLAVKWPEVCDTSTPRRPAVEILGLADQQYHVRQPRPAHEPPHSSARLVRPVGKLFAKARASASLGTVELELRARPQQPALTCAVVRVWEPQPPAGVKPLKTGMNVEALQLATAHAWFAATALLSVAALRLLKLREIARLTPEAPAALTGLSELELEVLAYRVKKPLKTVRDVLLGLGRLGGHLNRKGDGLPGWITLWRGWQYLPTLVEGALIGRKLKLKPD